MKVAVFPGQSSQFKGMGKALFNRFATETAQASATLGYDIQTLCTEDPDKKLNLTQYTQPALYVVSALLWKDKNQSLSEFDYLMGHSLGEYNALYAAGAFDFVTGLTLVKERGRLMAAANGGSMLAVLGMEVDQLQEFLQSNNLSHIEIANFNTASQLVLSGDKKQIQQLYKLLDKKSIRAIALNVSAAFHSSYMQAAAGEFKLFLDKIEFKPLSIPVIANATARPYPAHSIVEHLSRQITSSVLWDESVRYLMRQDKQFDVVEFSERCVLTKMITSIQTNEKPLQLAATSTTGTHVSKSSASHAAISPQQLGAKSFRLRYGLKYAYLAGAMYKGIASKELVVALAKAGLMGFLGTAGMSLKEVESQINYIQQQLSSKQIYGANLLCHLDNPQKEMKTAELFIQLGVDCIEASAFMQITPALVYYRLSGLQKNDDGSITCKHKIIAKVSRPEVAQAFLSPAPENIVKKLVDECRISQEQACMATQIAMSADICVEADSGGHTDQGIATVLLPAMQSLRQQIEKKYSYSQQIHIGLAGGLGTPQAALAAFIMGADFILTGSINQCTVEAGTSDSVKDLLQEINVQDTDYAPAGDMFELGAKVQVLKKSVFFPARANKLFALYNQYDSWSDIPEKIKTQIETRYFQKTFAQVWQETQEHHQQNGQQATLDKALTNLKHQMALVFRWYFAYATELAFAGDNKNRVDFQVHTGPALGAFNQWVKSSELASWRKRHVDQIAEKLMQETANLFNNQINKLAGV